MWLSMLFLFLFSFYFIDFGPKYNKEIEYRMMGEEEEEDDSEEEQEKVVERYQNKYLEKSKKMERTELSLEQLQKLKTSLLMETTPLGNVLMFYHSEKESFCYYSDHNIPYYFLEVIARRYIITFDCAILYVFLEDELEKLKNCVVKEVVEEVVENKKHSVFAKFKNYNKNNSISTSKAPLKQTGLQAINLKSIPIKEKSNRYTYEGKLMNFSFLQKVQNKKIVSYADYKRNLLE